MATTIPLIPISVRNARMASIQPQPVSNKLTKLELRTRLENTTYQRDLYRELCEIGKEDLEVIINYRSGLSEISLILYVLFGISLIANILFFFN